MDPLPKTGANLLIRLKVAQVETRGGARVEDKTRAKLNAALPGQVSPLDCGGEEESDGHIGHFETVWVGLLPVMTWRGPGCR